jgi:hypothetical protein
VEIKPEIHTAVLGRKGEFNHFGINKLSACLYGDKVEDIIEVEVSIAEDQTIPPSIQNDPKANEPDYWAWWDSERKKFSLIWSKYFLLDMCFPYGMPAEEERGRGKAYRVNVKYVKDYLV